jgi:(R,R)-butanediol dehydrogenase/meso-butanediol dehydrogenase/diacetyl reductase
VPTTMQAALYYGPRDIRLEEVAIPVLRSGICGTAASEWVAGPTTFPVRVRPPTAATSARLASVVNCGVS